MPEEVVRRTVTAELPGGGAQETPWKLGGYPAAGHWSYDSHGSDRPDGEPVVLNNKKYMTGDKAFEPRQYIQGVVGMAGQQRARQHRHGGEHSHNIKIMNREYVGVRAETQWGTQNALAGMVEGGGWQEAIRSWRMGSTPQDTAQERAGRRWRQVGRRMGG